MELFDGFPVKIGFSGPDWELENCATLARLHPGTFEVPAPEEAALVALGDLLRLHFLVTDPEINPDANAPRAERMWVEVCAPMTNGLLRGHLTNQPKFISTLDPGDVIEFRWDHVAQVYVKTSDPRHSK